MVDDNPVDLLVNRHVLSAAISDAEVAQKNSAPEALDYLRENLNNLPDLVLLDIKMPEMDGFEFLEELKKILPAENQMRIYMLSSSIDPQDIQKAAEEPVVTDFIHKPLRVEVVKDFL